MNKEQILKQNREWARNWRKNNPGVQAKRSKIWREKHPERWKEVIKKYRDKNQQNINIKNKEYYQKHKDIISRKAKEKYKRWREKHPCKTQAEGWETIRKKVLERDNYICQICGKKANEVHHTDGSGSNHFTRDMNNNIDNLITLCHACHMKIEIDKVGSFSNGKWKEEKERNIMIYNLSKRIPQSQVARNIGISRQRISQIIKKHLTRY